VTHLPSMRMKSNCGSPGAGFCRNALVALGLPQCVGYACIP
jgi:hypothetical protein